MKKLFLMTALLLTFFTATSFAAEPQADQPAPTENQQTPDTLTEYTSKAFGFKMVCPPNPAVVVNPVEKLEELVYQNEGMKVTRGIQVKLDAFNTNEVPDFNKASKKTIQEYLDKLKKANSYEVAELVNISKDNKGVFVLTAKEIDVLDDKGEVEGTLVADSQIASTFFRTKSGRCIEIQLLSDDFGDDVMKVYRHAVATYKDATDLSGTKNGKDKKKK